MADDDFTYVARSGLKRELSFALSSQARFPVLPSRTRPRRRPLADTSPSPPPAAEDYSTRPKKRLKKSSDHMPAGGDCRTLKIVFKCSGMNAAPSSSLLSEDTDMKMPKKVTPAKTSKRGKLTKKDLGLHKMVFMNNILPEGTELGYFLHGREILKGYVKGSGIFCPCCEKVISPSQFEAHAGQAPRRKPYNNIYTSNGVSLHELSISLSKDRKITEKKTDDLCSICTKGGQLLICDFCPRAFHLECAGVSNLPEGEWQCSYCVGLRQRESYVSRNENAIAAGRIAGIDPIQQIFTRCIRIVQTSEIEDQTCALCKICTFTRSGFDDQTVIKCDHCEKEYHVGCLRDYKIAELKEMPPGKWFCCSDCSDIAARLKELVLSGDQPVASSSDDDLDIKWRLIKGENATPDTKFLLTKALRIFHGSFDPIIDVASGRNLIPDMVYGVQEASSDYRGMYCALLTVGSSVVSAAILRVIGSSVAELPLVATKRKHRGRGYFQVLFSCVERLLGDMNVKHIVLPACEVAEPMWVEKFKFRKTSSEELDKYANGASWTYFLGTSMLHKTIS